MTDQQPSPEQSISFEEEKVVERSKVFISYARADGEKIAKKLHEVLSSLTPPISVWWDRKNMYPGLDWLFQIKDAIRETGAILLVVTPAATRSANVQKEWDFARKLGIPIIPVFVSEFEGTGNLRPDFMSMPKRIRDSHMQDMHDLSSDEDWNDLIEKLSNLQAIEPAPFEVPSQGDHYPRVYEKQVKNLIYDSESHNPKPRLISIYGRAGVGKSEIANAICHDEEIIMAYDDGIIWLDIQDELGTDETRLIELLTQVYLLLSRKNIQFEGFSSLSHAQAEISAELEDKDVIIVADGIQQQSSLRALVGCLSETSSLLVTTRNRNIALESNAQVKVKEFTFDEAFEMLTSKNLIEKIVNGLRVEVEADNEYSLSSYNEHEKRIIRRIYQKIDDPHDYDRYYQTVSADLRQISNIVRGIPGDIAIIKAYILNSLAEGTDWAIIFDDIIERFDVEKSGSHASIEIALKEFAEREKGLVYQLGIFPASIEIPESLIYELWRVPEEEGGRIIKRLENSNLVDSRKVVGLNGRKLTLIQIGESVRASLDAKLTPQLKQQLNKRIIDLDKKHLFDGSKISPLDEYFGQLYSRKELELRGPFELRRGDNRLRFNKGQQNDEEETTEVFRDTNLQIFHRIGSKGLEWTEKNFSREQVELWEDQGMLAVQEKLDKQQVDRGKVKPQSALKNLVKILRRRK